MTYTNLALMALGFFGILLHNLVELNKINRQSSGNLKIRQYLKLEVFSIAISVCMVVAALILKHEIAQLEAAGKWLGLAFVTIGYMGQSLLIFVMGKANKVIDKPNETT